MLTALVNFDQRFVDPVVNARDVPHWIGALFGTMRMAKLD